MGRPDPGYGDDVDDTKLGELVKSLSGPVGRIMRSELRIESRSMASCPIAPSIGVMISEGGSDHADETKAHASNRADEGDTSHAMADVHEFVDALSDDCKMTAPAASAVMSLLTPRATPAVAAIMAGASLMPSPRYSVGAMALSSPNDLNLLFRTLAAVDLGNSHGRREGVTSVGRSPESRTTSLDAGVCRGPRMLRNDLLSSRG